MLIDVLRGRPETIARLERLRSSEDGPPFICAINVEEVWRGARKDEHGVVDRLLNGMRIAPLGVEEGKLAGRWRAEFAARGITLGQADCLIAAAALGAGARLATGNPRDFPMDEVKIETWPVGR